MHHYTLWHALIGGIMIGLASLAATVLSGKIPGISGVFGRLLVPATSGKTWRAVFLFGLIGGAALSFALWQSAALFRPMRPLVVMAIAGFLVGFGTRLGGGCNQRSRRLRRRDGRERFDRRDTHLHGDGDHDPLHL